MAVLLGLWFGAPRAEAQCATPAPDADVTVGIRIAKPFIFRDPIRGLTGLSIELWQSVAQDLIEDGEIADYVFVECSHHDQMQALTAGSLDVVISPLTITSLRLENGFDRFGSDPTTERK